jgi:hypothetical protein
MRSVVLLAILAALLAACTGHGFVSIPTFDNSCFSCGPPMFYDDESQQKYGP